MIGKYLASMLHHFQKVSQDPQGSVSGDGINNTNIFKRSFIRNFLFFFKKMLDVVFDPDVCSRVGDTYP